MKQNTAIPEPISTNSKSPLTGDNPKAVKLRPMMLMTLSAAINISTPMPKKAMFL
jgi:hypothetical protein